MPNRQLLAVVLLVSGLAALAFIDGLSGIRERPNLIGRFKRRGWNDADLGKAMGGNWLRVSRQVWGG